MSHFKAKTHQIRFLASVRLPLAWRLTLTTQRCVRIEASQSPYADQFQFRTRGLSRRLCPATMKAGRCRSADHSMDIRWLRPTTPNCDWLRFRLVSVPHPAFSDGSAAALSGQDCCADSWHKGVVVGRSMTERFGTSHWSQARDTLVLSCGILCRRTSRRCHHWMFS